MIPSPLLLIFITSFSCSLLSYSCLSLDLQFSFPMFNPNEPSLKFSNNSNIDNQALQVTRNSGSRDVSHTSGQITYIQPLQLWHSSHNYSASFNTSFLLNIGPIMGGGTNASGGGMTFMLTSLPAISHLPDSSDQWLGLFDGNSTQQEAQLVAIEFDTFKDRFDLDGNHVGVDVNGSVDSVLAIPLSEHNLSLTDTSTAEGMYTSVWIDYDGHLFTLDVYLANQGSNLSTKPAVPIIYHYPIDLRKYLSQTVYVGFSASLGTILESHCVLQWSFTSTAVDLKSTPNIAIIVGSTIGSVAIVSLVAILVAMFLIRRKRRQQAFIGILEDLTCLHYGPREFRYRDLKKATNGFSEECSLGRGGFGVVYKGVLRANNGTTEVAVKCLSQKSKQGEKEFKAEVMSMGRMRHKNLVQLLGWSYRSSRLMLVYEYLPNKSLDRWIGQGLQEGEDVMGWERRFHVMKGLAAGLLYLHEEWEKVVIHRDLKPSNVMLDAEFNARIGDFGLAKLIDMEQESAQTATIAGTFGYMAPESVEQGIISKETDIYSLGAIAIELATGHRISIDFLHRLACLLEEATSPQEAADPRLSSFDPTQLELLLRLGLACCHPHPPARPGIRDVVHALSTAGASPLGAAPSSLSSFSSSSYVSSIPRLQDTSDSSLAAVELTTAR